MNNTLKIGITGGIGSGKTTVSKVFEQLGVPLYNSDERAKWLMNHNPIIVKKVTELFGEEAYQNNALNRAHVAKLAFSNKTLIEQLNSVVHPEVFKDFDNWIKAHAHYPYVLKEAALLFESNSYLTLDAMIVVDAPLEERINRVTKRDGITTDDVLKRISNQMPDEQKLAAADFIITNHYEPLLPQVLFLHKLWS
jgi:dephospho-CoA kinase